MGLCRLQKWTWTYSKYEEKQLEDSKHRSDRIYLKRTLAAQGGGGAGQELERLVKKLSIVNK